MEAGGNIATSSIVFKPSVSSSYSNGWRQLWKHFLELFLILIIVFAISVVGGLFGYAGGFLAFISVVYGLLISNIVSYSSYFAYLKAAKEDKVEVGDAFAAFKNYWNAVLANLLVSVIVSIEFVLIIVPSIVFTCKLAFTPYLVMDRKMEVIKAVKTSWRMTKGHAWKVFLIGLMGIPITIAGLICLGVGVIISIMWISIAIASLYHSVSLLSEASA